MSDFPFYREKAEGPPAAPVALPRSPLEDLRDASHYQPSKALAKAVNVALLLGQPLLVTGEPGTGKTELAGSLAWQLGYGRPVRFEARSTSEAKDLFYNFDTLGRFHAEESARGRAADFIRYHALGRAILRTRALPEVAEVLPTAELARHDGPAASVVLIDEIDKAPRDFPNDILNEIERLEFTIPELGYRPIQADPAFRPVILLTSNAEKSLPPAFLRRCVYFHIEFPDRETLDRIVESRVGQFPGRGLVAGVIDFFLELRSEENGLRKKPATAELLGWISYLHRRGADPSKPLKYCRETAAESLGILVKEREDYTVASGLLQTFLKKS
jgi:MoxR-like ATPase